MAEQFNFNILNGGQGNPHMKKQRIKDKAIPYPLRFLTKEKYLYVSRISFFHQESINEVADGLMFPRGWEEKNDELKAKQEKLGISDAEIKSRRKKRLRRWRLEKHRLKKAA